jgi:sulfur relay (sulfurtransferase) DsrC/TusE family protein
VPMPWESTTIHIIHINIFNFLSNYFNKYNTTCLIKSSKKQSKEEELHAKKVNKEELRARTA